MLNRSLRCPSHCSAISRCPVLEIGRNSVMPSMMPSSRAASRSVTGSAAKGERHRIRVKPPHAGRGQGGAVSRRHARQRRNRMRRAHARRCPQRTRAPSIDTRRATPAFELHNPAGLYDPAPNGYSHVASIAPGARWVLVAGQGGERADGALPPDFRAQVRQALANLVVALAAADAAPRDVAGLTVLVVDHDEARLAVLGEELAVARGPAHRPTCTLVPVPRLAQDGVLFEVAATACMAGHVGA